jgi:glycosyltransferase involved in cell wall biosynthesis
VGARSASPLKISLIATVKDGAPFVRDFVESIRAQTHPPDEVVIVDGGSSDGTVDLLRAANDVRVIQEPGANIAHGRNVAVRAAIHEAIAVSDADCVLAPDWLERMLPALEDGADVVAGAYRPLSRSFFETCLAAVSVKDPDEIRPGWMPSHRSVAFHRSVFERAGGYPEWLEIGEDMYLNHQFGRVGARMALAREAVAYWRPRPTLGETWKQYGRYAEGDARAEM